LQTSVSWHIEVIHAWETQAMHQLIGKIPIKHRGVIEEVYLAEHVQCGECQRTVPVGIEVITVRLEGKSKKVLKHAWYCRAHGLEYQARAES
jgi:hypothetical protein